MAAPHPEGAGAALALARAFADASLDPSEIGFINAHGTGTPLNDVAEFAAFKSAFGARASEVPLTSTKGVVGHLLGSSGAIEAIATVLGLPDREVHPTPGGGRVDPAIGARLVLDTPQAVPGPRAAPSTSLAFAASTAPPLLTPRGPSHTATPPAPP